MATTRRPAPSGLHAPLSNEPDDEQVRLRKEISAPSEGHETEGSQATQEGAEVVEGYEPIAVEVAALSTTAESEPAVAARRAAIADVAELYRAPDTGSLPDIAEASYGAPPSIEAVIGTDDRTQIHATSVYPWRAHASLLITAADNSQWIGTGWFIGPHTLMTAGHCVFIRNSGVQGRDGWVRRITVMPGRNGATLPYGSIVSSQFRSVTGWTTNGDHNYDYGAIILPSDLGLTTGWFGFGVWSDSDLLAVTANISGYPGDKPSGTQWYHARRVMSVNSRKVYYDVDTAGGQSGSAVYRIINGARYGVAIHAYGGSTSNSGTRITSPVMTNMQAWKA